MIQSRLHQLGLQSLFAEVFYLTSLRSPAELTQSKESGLQETFESLHRLLGSAIEGLMINRLREAKGNGEISRRDLNRVVIAESAYDAILPLLADVPEQEKKLQALVEAAEKILRFRRQAPADSADEKAIRGRVEEIRKFAKKAAVYFETEQYENLAGARERWL